MSDLNVGIRVGATMDGSVRTAVGGAMGYLGRLERSTEQMQRTVGRVTALRQLTGDLERTRTRARQAAERVVRVGAAMRQVQQPTAAMARNLADARAEAGRLTERQGKLTRQLGQLRREMRRAGESTENLDARERQLGRTLERQQRRLVRLGRAHAQVERARERRGAARGRLLGATAFGAATAAPIIGMARAAIDFESQMADVRKVVDFDTPQQFGQMGRDILAMSERLPIAASGIAQIVAAAGQAGIARGELLGFAEDAAKTAVAFDISAEEAGSRLAGMRNIYQLNRGELMSLAGSYNHLSNNMDATAPAILRVSERTGSTARLLGFTGEQVGALAATFLALKTPPEVAGTAINAMLTKLSTAPQQSAAFHDALAELGMDAHGLKEAFENDAQGALLNFLEAVEQAEDKQAILFALFGQEYVDDVAKLAGGMDGYRRALELAGDKTAALTAIEKEYTTRAATTANNLQLLSNRTNVLGVNLGTVLLPTINDAVGLLGSLISKGAALAAEYPGVTKVVVGLVGGIGALTLGSALAGYAVSFVAEGWGRGRIALLRAAGGVRWLSGRLYGLGRRAVPAAIAGLGRLRAGMRSTAAGAAMMGRGLRGVARRAIPAVIGGMRLLRGAMISTGLGAIPVLLGVGAQLIIENWDELVEFFTGIGEWLWKQVQPFIEPIERAFNWVFGSDDEAAPESPEGPVTGATRRPVRASGTQAAAGLMGAMMAATPGAADTPDARAFPPFPPAAVYGDATAGGGERDYPAFASPPDDEADAGPVVGQTFDEPEITILTPPPAFPLPLPVVIEGGIVARLAPGVAFGPDRETPAIGATGVEPASAPDEHVADRLARIQAGLSQLAGQGEVGAVPLADDRPTFRAAQPGAVQGAAIVIHMTNYFEGAGPEDESEITRRMELIMRRASVMAGLAEVDGVF